MDADNLDINNQPTPVEGELVDFQVDDKPVGSALTANGTGVASFLVPQSLPQGVHKFAAFLDSDSTVFAPPITQSVDPVPVKQPPPDRTPPPPDPTPVPPQIPVQMSVPFADDAGFDVGATDGSMFSDSDSFDAGMDVDSFTGDLTSNSFTGGMNDDAFNSEADANLFGTGDPTNFYTGDTCVNSYTASATNDSFSPVSTDGSPNSSIWDHGVFDGWADDLDQGFSSDDSPFDQLVSIAVEHGTTFPESFVSDNDVKDPSFYPSDELARTIQSEKSVNPSPWDRLFSGPQDNMTMDSPQWSVMPSAWDEQFKDFRDNNGQSFDSTESDLNRRADASSSLFIVPPRAQASRRCETQATLGGKPPSYASVSVP